MLVKNAGRHAAQTQRMLFIVKRETLLADLRQPFLQVVRRQRMLGIGLHALFMQQFGDLIVRQGGQKGFAGTGGVHRQFAADGRRHAHQRGALHLVDNYRLVLAGIQYRQVNRFARLFHQATQRGVHHRQQITALQKTAAHHKGV
ncbi:hypothetical protein D3C72_1826130 [compost metagenome]